MPWPIFARDLVLLCLTLALWGTDTIFREGSPGWLATGVAVLTGLLTAVCGYLAHEWGHFVGARLGSSVIHLGTGPRSVFLFNFDSNRNGRSQFLVMSVGGFVASALVIGLLVALLPLDATSGRVAIVLAGLGVVATLVLELPPFWSVVRGGPIPRGLGYRSD